MKTNRVKSRERRKRKRRSTHRTQDLYSENAVRSILRALGVDEILRGTQYKEYLLGLHFPGIHIHLSPDETSDRTRQIVKELRSHVDEAHFECPFIGRISVAYYLSYVIPIVDHLRRWTSSVPEKEAILTTVREKCAILRCSETLHEPFEAICNDLRTVLVQYSRLDDRLFTLAIKGERTKRGVGHIRLDLHEHRSEIVTENIDGSPRRAFRSGQSGIEGDIIWVSWSGEMVGKGDKATEYPVYVQSHAIERLYGRAGRLGLGKEYEGMLHEFLWYSLYAPVMSRIANGAADQVLVEYRVGDYKLGYLVAVVLSDKVIVKTFLFLTMDGTPEGDALRRRLRLSRSDKQYLGLDSFHDFARTDLSTDPELKALFTECGCRDLFDFADERRTWEAKAGVAAEVKRFLSIHGATRTSLHTPNGTAGQKRVL